MHTSRRFAFFASMAMVVVGGCRRNEPATAMLPDTPEVMRPPARPSPVEFAPPPGETASPTREDVRLLQQRIDAQNRIFANVGDPRTEAGSEPAPSRNPRRDVEPPETTNPRMPSPRPLAKPPQPSQSQEWMLPAEKPLARPPEGALRPPVEPFPANKDDESVAPSAAPARPTSPQVPATQPQPADPKFAKPDERVASTATTDVDLMARDIAKRLKEHPADVAAHFHQQMFRFLRDEPVPQLQTMTPLPLEDREMLSAVLDGLSDWLRGVQTDPNALPSRKVLPLLKMAARLREQTELAIPTIALCRRVDGYGIYEPMQLSFRAGLEHETIIYCEVENFSSRLNDKQHWETKLSMEAVLYNSAGDAILKGKDNVPVDLCRNRRRDFFVVKRLKLPSTLAASRYILKVTIVDEQAKRIAENSLNIMMMAQ